MTGDSSEKYSLLARLADEIAARFRRGERPSLQEYLDRYPNLTEDIREFFPAMAEIEQVKEDHREASEPAASPRLKQLGDFRILREVGQGGMGIVYEAEQVSLGRHVALKILPRKMLMDSKAKRRFEREARAAARLHHTHIVPVFGSGEDDGLPYYVMQFIQGLGMDVVLEELQRLKEGGGDMERIASLPMSGMQSVLSASAMARSLLTGEFHPAADSAADGCEAIQERPPVLAAHADPAVETDFSYDQPGQGQDLSSGSIALPGHSSETHLSPGRKKQTYWHSVAHIGVQVADALEYAHKQGILHRDIKPSNLLLDMQGTVWVTDFGLAKADDQPNLTHTGDILGTLRYMPPEAFEGKSDARGDQYSLGLTLYELLAFRPAFDERDRARLIKQVTSMEPVRLRKLNRQVPRDLETIVHKAIDRDPARRYPTALELADDLQRFLADEPIQARRMSAAERLFRWSRRNKPLAASLSAVALLLVLIALSSIGLAAYFHEQEMEQRRLLNDNLTLAEDRGKALAKAGAALTDLQVSSGLTAGERDDPVRAMLWFATAAEHAKADPQRQAENRLRARNWAQTAVLPIRAVSVGGYPTLMEFRPGGDLLLLRTAGGFYVWDWRQDKLLSWADSKSHVLSACWSPDGAQLALGMESGEIEIRSVPDGAVLHQLNYPHPVSALAYSPDGRYLAMARDAVRIWDVQTQTTVKDGWIHPQPVAALAFNRKGDRLVTYGVDRKARVFAVAGSDSAGPVCGPVAHEPVTTSLPVFVDNDHGLITITSNNQMTHLTHWDVERGKQIRVIGTAPFNLQRIAASAGGNWFAAGGMASVQVWNAADASGKSILLKHSNQVHDLVFSPDGKMVLSVSFDQTGQIWSLPDGRPIGSPLPHMENVGRCAFASDNLHLATESNGLIRIWKRPALDDARAEVLSWGTRARLSFDGKLIAPGAWYESPIEREHLEITRLIVLDAQTGQPAGPTIPLSGFLVDSCIGADHRTVAAVHVHGKFGYLSAWDVRTGRALFEPQLLRGAPLSIAARPRGSHLAVLAKPGFLTVFDSQTGQMVQQAHDLESQPVNFRWPRVEYTPDGETLLTLTSHANNVVHVRDANTGQLRYPPIRPVLQEGPCRSIAISADSRLLATAVNGKNAAQVWDLATGRALSEPLRHPGDFYGLFHLCFSGDGRHLLTGSKDGLARLWDWQAGKLVCPPMQHSDEVLAVALTPDGRHAVTASRGSNASLHVWELRAGKQIAPPIRLVPAGWHASTLAFFGLSADGRRAYATLYWPKSVRPIDLGQLLSPSEMPPEDFHLLGKLASGYHVELGDLSRLTTEQWLEGMNRFRERQPEFAQPPYPEAVAAHRRSAQLYFESDRFLEATAHLRQAFAEIDRAPENDRQRPTIHAGLHLQRAKVLKALGKKDAANDDARQAQALLLEALSRNPDQAEAASQLAEVLLEGRTTEGWTVLQPTEMKTSSGAVLTLQPDGSILASGKNADNDTYTIQFQTDLQGITALRLEVLPDSTLSGHGPGRGNGNFCLTEIALTAAPADTPDSVQPIGFARAAGHKRPLDSATTVRDGPQGAIDGTHLTRWDVGHRLGMASTAVFETARPIPGNRTTLTLRLDFQSIYKLHNLGRFRLSASTRPRALRDETLTFLAEGESAWTRLGLALVLRGECPQAVEALRKSISLSHGTTPRDHLLLVLAHEQLGQRDDADRQLALAITGAGHLPSDPLLHELASESLSARVDRDPKDPTWFLYRSRCHARLDRAANAGTDLSQALAIDPKLALTREDLPALRTLGDAAAVRAKWPEASTYFARATELAPEDTVLRHSHILLCLLRGDRKGYQASCAELLEKYGKKANLSVANIISWTCALGPDAVEDFGLLLPLAETSSAKVRTWQFVSTFGAILYRAGKYEMAIEQLNAGIKFHAAGGGPWDWFFLAMAHERLGKRDEARDCFKVATASMGDAVRKKSLPWRERLTNQLLHDEAEKLLGATPPVAIEKLKGKL